MTVEELVKILQAKGQGTEVRIEGCCGACSQEIGDVVENGVVVEIEMKR